MGYKEIWNTLDLSKVSKENPEESSYVRDFAGMFYQLMQWELAVPSSEVLKRMPVKDLKDWLKSTGADTDDCLFLEIGSALDYFLKRETGMVFLYERSMLDLWSGPTFSMDKKKHRSAGHYLLYKQAEYHNNTAAMEEVMQTISGEQAKGIEIENSIGWQEVIDRLKKEAVYQHIKQIKDAIHEMSETEDYEIVWCWKDDGIGLGICDPKRFDRANWKGDNSYGKLLMEIRDRLKTEGRLKAWKQ